MALTSSEIERYLEMALNVKHLPKKDFYLSYDSKADVVYINFYNPAKPADDSELTDDDVIIRYDKQEQVVGLTILHASSRWRLESNQSNQEKTKTPQLRMRVKVVPQIGSQRPRPTRTRTKPSS